MFRQKTSLTLLSGIYFLESMNYGFHTLSQIYLATTNYRMKKKLWQVFPEQVGRKMLRHMDSLWFKVLMNESKVQNFTEILKMLIKRATKKVVCLSIFSASWEQVQTFISLLTRSKELYTYQSARFEISSLVFWYGWGSAGLHNLCLYDQNKVSVPCRNCFIPCRVIYKNECNFMSTTSLPKI